MTFWLKPLKLLLLKWRNRTFKQSIALQIKKSSSLNLLTEGMLSTYSETKKKDNSINRTKMKPNQQKYTRMNLLAHTFANWLENVIASWRKTSLNHSTQQMANSILNMTLKYLVLKWQAESKANIIHRDEWESW